MSLTDFRKVTGFLPRDICGMLGLHLAAEAEAGRLRQGDRQVPHSIVAAGTDWLNGLLYHMWPAMEAETGESLLPTYGYARIYLQGTNLRYHTDREACEVSATITLVPAGDDPWPISIERRNGVAESVLLAPGDALLYLGGECAHWRGPLPRGRHTQVFLHYVRRGGPHAHLSDAERSIRYEFPAEHPGLHGGWRRETDP